MSGDTKFTPGPWSWAGEDYRGGWGWMLLVGPSGEGIACGADKDGGIYRGLRAYEPIAPELCKTGFYADKDSAPAFHVRQHDAALIAAAPELYAALSALFEDYKNLADSGDAGRWSLEDLDVGKQAMSALSKARGEA